MMNTIKNYFPSSWINPAIFVAKGPEALPQSSYKASEISKIHLNQGQLLNVEPEALLACKDVEMTTNLNGSGVELFKRSLLGGEAIFQNTFSVAEGKTEGWVALEESVPGQIATHQLKSEDSLLISRKAYVASDSNVKISTVYSGFLGMFKGVGFSQLKATLEKGETGKVFFTSSQGTVKSIDITPLNPVIVDNKNIVAYTGDIHLSTQLPGNMKSFFLSGEGSLTKAEGKGTIFIGSGEAALKTNAVDNGVNHAKMPLAQAAIVGVVTIISSIALAYTGNQLKQAVSKTCGPGSFETKLGTVRWHTLC